MALKKKNILISKRQRKCKRFFFNRNFKKTIFIIATEKKRISKNINKDESSPMVSY